MIRIASVALALCFLATPARAADAPKPPKGVVTIKAPATGGKQGNVHFKHETHKQECAVCHGDGKPGKIEALEQHDQKKSHALCQECHKKEVAAGNKKAPTAKCDGCHEKKAAAS